ncbi:MAG: hypothetical protein QOH53_2635 [Ilumatobacteraceae bacterium]|jgi:hypothetical protein
MRIDRLLATAVALVASTMAVSCGDDNNVTPSNNSGNSPSVVNSVPVQDTTPAVATEPVGGPGY